MASSRHWLRVRDIVERALDLSDDDREAFLRRACEGENELLDEVRDLLLLDTAGGQELTPPHPGAFGPVTGRKELLADDPDDETLERALHEIEERIEELEEDGG